MALKFQIVSVTPFMQNCTLLWCDETLQTAIVDPGGDVPRIVSAIESRGLRPEKILVTHGHLDHAGGVFDLAQILGIPIEGPQREDKFLIDAMQQQGSAFGLSGVFHPFMPERWLEQGDRVSFGKIEMDVLHCPGHTPGHVVFYHAPSRLLISGDVLFQGSIGRTDFPRGDFDTLISSIRTRLWPLGDDVRFISGHGPMSTLGEERMFNPFCAD
jgi:glyoxylase-like metal-dependent hydrolase (beta-lactamase superfamily II)